MAPVSESMPSSPQDFRSSAECKNGNDRNNISQDPLSRKLAGASHYFRDSSFRFSGSIDSPMSLYRFKQMLSSTVRQYQIPAKSTIPLMLSDLERTASDFYFDNISRRVSILREAYRLLDDRSDFPYYRAQKQTIYSRRQLCRFAKLSLAPLRVPLKLRNRK